MWLSPWRKHRLPAVLASGANSAPFDVHAFETLIEQRLLDRVDLQVVAYSALALTLVLCVAGICLWWRLRKQLPVVAGLEPAQWSFGFVVLVTAASLPCSIAVLRLQKLFAPAGGASATLVAGGMSLLVLAVGALGIAHFRGHMASFRLQAKPNVAFLRVGVWGWLLAFPLLQAVQWISCQVAGWVYYEPEVNPAVSLFLTTSSPLTALVVAGVAVIAAPIAEEILFRGVLYGALRRHGVWVATVVSALLFALLHPVIDMPAVFVLGVLMGLVYEVSGSLWVPMAMHAVNNAYAMGELIIQRILAFG